MAAAYRLERFERERERRRDYERNYELYLMVASLWSKDVKFPRFESGEEGRPRPQSLPKVREIRQKRPGRAASEADLMVMSRAS